MLLVEMHLVTINCLQMATNGLLLDALLQVNPRTVVCSAHFSTECFKRKSGHGAYRLTLKPDAVPTVFPWTKQVTWLS